MRCPARAAQRVPAARRAVGGGHDCGRPRHLRPDRPKTLRAGALELPRPPRLSPRDSRSVGGGRVPAPETTIDHGRAKSGGEVRAALGATASNHRAAGAIAHPKSETVLLLASPVVRLVCAFHPWPPRSPGPRKGPRGGRAASTEHARKWTAESTGSSRAAAIRRQTRSGPARGSDGALRRRNPQGCRGVFAHLVGIPDAR
ncbi:MAG: hypothetical protein QOJ71_3160 [Actinomycetota bacterium]|nr:hypothetical protein [Actinomycetota bacterium]